MRLMSFLVPAAVLCANPAVAQEIQGPDLKAAPEDLFVGEVDEASARPFGAMFDRAVVYRDSFGSMPVPVDDESSAQPISYRLPDEGPYGVFDFFGAKIAYGLVEDEEPPTTDDRRHNHDSVEWWQDRFVGLHFFFNFSAG